MNRFKFHGIKILGCSLLILYSAGVMAAPAQQAVAKVQFVVGGVSATAVDGGKRWLKKGDQLYTGDTIESNAQGAAQLIYRDRSRMAVRVNTKFRIDNFEYDATDNSAGSSIFSLLTGALRSVSGLIGKINPQNVAVTTPVATIGIRGTDHEIVHVTEQDGATKLAVDPGTYNKVYSGATVMKTEGGILNLKLNQVGFVSGIGGNIVQPIQIKSLPKAIKEQLVNKITVQAQSGSKTQEATGDNATKPRSVESNGSNSGDSNETTGTGVGTLKNSAETSNKLSIESFGNQSGRQNGDFKNLTPSRALTPNSAINPKRIIPPKFDPSRNILPDNVPPPPADDEPNAGTIPGDNT